jgi:hypothetical protein
LFLRLFARLCNAERVSLKLDVLQGDDRRPPEHLRVSPTTRFNNRIHEGVVIPGTNAIAFAREVRALARLEGWCSALCVRPSFEARKSSHLRMTLWLQQGWPEANGNKNPSSHK